MKLNKASKIASILTAGALLNPVKAERLSGYIDHVNTFEPLEDQVVQVEGLDSDVSDGNGFYEITSNSVDPDYRFPTFGINEGRLYDTGGRQITKLNKNDLTSKLMPSNVNLPIGKYFIKLDNGLTVPYLVLEQFQRTLPDILGSSERADESSKNSARTNTIRTLTINGEGYHALQRSMDISDNTQYSPFMIPVQERDSVHWAYPTDLDCFKSYCSGLVDGKPLGPRPEDLPIDIYLTQSLEDIQDSTGTDWASAIQSAISDAENNGELNWFNNSLIYIDQQQLQEIEKGVILRFTNTPRGEDTLIQIQGEGMMILHLTYGKFRLIHG